MTVRFTMMLGDELNDFAQKEANRIGISRNAFVAMCVDNIRNQKESMKMTSEVSLLAAKMEEEEKKK